MPLSRNIAFSAVLAVAIFAGGCTGTPVCPLPAPCGQPTSAPTAAIPARHAGDGRAYDAPNGFSFVPPPGYARQDRPAPHALSFLGPGEDGFARNISVSAESHYLTSWDHKITIDGQDDGRGTFGALNLYLAMRFYLTEH